MSKVKTKLSEVQNTKADMPSATEHAVQGIEIKAESLVSDLRDFLIGHLKELPAMSFDALDEAGQQSLADKVEEKVRQTVFSAVRIIAGKEADALPAKIESITVKDGIKLTVKAGETADNYAMVGRIMHKDVMIVGLSLAAFNEIQTAATITPDQKALALEEDNVTDFEEAKQQEGNSWKDAIAEKKAKDKKKKS